MKTTTPFAALLLALLMVSCREPQPQDSILPAGFELRAGDVVFRRGGSMMSRSVVALDAHGRYSHVGIVVDSSGQKMVVHAVPGEPDFAGDEDRVKMDAPERFFSSVNAIVGEVCRPADSLSAAHAAQEALRIYRRHVLFDHDYDADDTTRMYCTEVVALAYERAGVALLPAEPHHINIPGLHVDCYFPSDLYDSGLLVSVGQFHR